MNFFLAPRGMLRSAPLPHSLHGSSETAPMTQRAWMSTSTSLNVFATCPHTVLMVLELGTMDSPIRRRRQHVLPGQFPRPVHPRQKLGQGPLHLRCYAHRLHLQTWCARSTSSKVHKNAALSLCIMFTVFLT